MKRIFTFILSRPIIGILFLSLCLRILYFAYNSNLVANPDISGYYSRAVKLKTGNPMLIIFSDERVPLYPLIISGLTNPKTLLNPYQIPPVIPGYEKLLVFNTVLGFGIIVFSVAILQILFSPVWLIYLIGILIGTNSALLYWEHVILPETLTTFLLTIFAYTALRCLKKTSGFHSFLFLFISLLLFLTKPVFILLPFAIFILLALNKTNSRQLFYSSLSVIFYSLLLIIYMWGNIHFHGYHGINHVGDINLLGRIMQFNLPIKPENNSSFFDNKLTEYRTLGKENNPFRFLEWSDEAIYGTGWLMEDLRKFTNTIVKQNLFLYMQLALPDVLPALTTFDIPKDIYTQNYPLLFQILLRFSILIRYSCVLLIFFFPMYGVAWVYNFFKINTHKLRYAQLFLIAGISMYMALTAAIGSYDSFGRLTTPALPLTFIILGIGIMDIIHNLKTRITKRNSSYHLK